MSNDQIAEKYGLVRLYSATTGEPFNSWFRVDRELYIDLTVGRKYRIVPNSNDMGRVGHIDFTKLRNFDTFEEAVQKMMTLDVKPHEPTWEPTMRLRWRHINSERDARYSVAGAGSERFGCFGSKLVLTQLWRSNEGGSEWRIIEVAETQNPLMSIHD